MQLKNHTTGNMTSFPVRTFPSHSSFLITDASNQVLVSSNYGIYVIPTLFFCYNINSVSLILITYLLHIKSSSYSVKFIFSR